MWGGAVKYVAVRRLALFEKTSFDEFRNSLRDLGSPVSDVSVEHPPLKDAIYRVLRLRLPSQVFENFPRRRS